MTTWLQGIGKCEAIPAKDLKVGDVTKWNYGFTETILAMSFSKSGKTIIANIRDDESGKLYERKMRAERPVVLA